MKEKTDRQAYNELIFKTINTPTNAYLFGYLWADGHIAKNGYTLSASCKDGDQYLLELCQKNIGGRLYLRKRNDKRFKVSEYKIWEFYANNKKIINQLNLLGFRKNINSIPIDLRHFFIRGYLDGDGCIYVNKKHYLFQLAFSSGETNWNWLIECLPEEIKKGYTFSDKKRQIRWCGKNAKNILKWIYSDVPSIGLKRKKEIYDIHI